ncbi:bifunctional hydroxymethylpyrimidine kinase/phosphomethylpyrimidine kinase [Sciscionella marina]|uniref:bifunctional hydroxymethylpyrimidine kinase/phosphomethylpyrimidine kinase n=1 Tax=Sciscionella marina TaxID=508770 RepID=UPI00035D237A|nr:bifunctional hydroxymethylpyrimidine kinase/phosphomethylpyrimidine kinase [Sciscionella marina]
MRTTTPPTALTIAGTDSGGGAGIAADLRAFFASGVHGMLAVAAVTVQNSVGVEGFTELPVSVVSGQIEAVATDIGVGAAKTGMLPTAAIIETVAQSARTVGIGGAKGSPFVVDPVAASMHGDPLLREDALEALRSKLFPLATLITPNLDEVRLLTGIEANDRDGMRAAARALHGFGPRWVLVKAGHLHDEADCVDVLYDGAEFHELPAERMATSNTHGGGDTMASAITAALAKGKDVPGAVEYGKWFVTNAVRDGYPHGKGVGPVSAFWRLAPDAHLD